VRSFDSRATWPPYKSTKIPVSLIESRSVGLGLSRRPPSTGQAPLAALCGSLGLGYVQLSCVTDVGLVCVVERCDFTELIIIIIIIITNMHVPYIRYCR